MAQLHSESMERPECVPLDYSTQLKANMRQGELKMLQLEPKNSQYRDQRKKTRDWVEITKRTELPTSTRESALSTHNVNTNAASKLQLASVQSVQRLRVEMCFKKSRLTAKSSGTPDFAIINAQEWRTEETTSWWFISPASLRPVVEESWCRKPKGFILWEPGVSWTWFEWRHVKINCSLLWLYWTSSRPVYSWSTALIVAADSVCVRLCLCACNRPVQCFFGGVKTENFFPISSGLTAPIC